MSAEDHFAQLEEAEKAVERLEDEVRILGIRLKRYENAPPVHLEELCDRLFGILDAGNISLPDMKILLRVFKAFKQDQKRT